MLGVMLLSASVLGVLALSVYMLHLDGVIRAQFEGKRWSNYRHGFTPGHWVIPRSAFEKTDELAHELELLRYRQVKRIEGPGTFLENNGTVDVYLRGFAFGTAPNSLVKSKSLSTLRRWPTAGLDGQEDPSLVRVWNRWKSPACTTKQEDRVLVQRKEIPPVLVDTLLAMEDRKFYEHFGVDPRGVIRALMVNLKAGRTVQGASTLTQQLVKNYFLTSERSFRRKINEALMALLLEWHYSKDELLEAYCNEIYLGQDGGRAIHGIGLRRESLLFQPAPR
ncbi:MAG: transglycosylase domain-containing protein [Candidatus Competibacteraceae bacterium]